MNKKKIEKILLSFLMVISFVSTSFVQFQNVNAVSYTMNTYNYLNGVANKKGAMMNDGTVLDESSYSGITVLLDIYTVLNMEKMFIMVRDMLMVMQLI